jgi:large subunit ribosomal protein L25
MNVPVHLTGNSIGVRKGGKLRLAMRYLVVKALPKNLPDFVEINVEDIDIGQSIKVGDLTIKNVTFLSNAILPVVDVQVSRLAALSPEEEAAEAVLAAAAATAAAEAPEAGATPAAPAAE